MIITLYETDPNVYAVTCTCGGVSHDGDNTDTSGVLKRNLTFIEAFDFAKTYVDINGNDEIRLDRILFAHSTPV